MKIAMTGASGFIGQWVVKCLLEQGHQVMAILHQHPLPIGHPNLLTVSVPLTQLASSPLAFARIHEPDVWLDLGWQHLDDYNNSSHIEQQPQLHAAVVRNLVRQGLSRVVVVGTCFEYGACHGKVDEHYRCKPEQAYPQGKLKLLELLRQQQQQNDFALAWLRLFYVYGLNLTRPTLFNAIASAAERGETEFELQTPNAAHDFLAVNELAEIIAAIAVLSENDGVINCCSGQLQSVKQVAQTFVEERQLAIKLTEAPNAAKASDDSFFGSTEKLTSVLRRANPLINGDN